MIPVLIDDLFHLKEYDISERHFLARYLRYTTHCINNKEMSKLQSQF